MALDNVTTELTNLADTGWAAYVGKSTDGSPDRFVPFEKLVNTESEQTIAGNKYFSNQAHGGYNVKTFSATGTFDADDGNNQIMTCTGDTTINITNESPGTFIIDLPISGGGVSAITIGASLGTAFDNTPDLVLTDGSVNTITVYVNPAGTKRYTINTITA